MKKSGRAPVIMYKRPSKSAAGKTKQSCVDRRVHSRYELAVPVRFLWKGTHGAHHRGEGYTHDVSKHGVYVLTDSCPPPQSRVRMELLLPPLKRRGTPVHMRGRAQVVRIESGVQTLSRGFAAKVDNFTLHNRSNGFSREAGGLTQSQPMVSGVFSGLS